MEHANIESSLNCNCEHEIKGSPKGNSELSISNTQTVSHTAHSPEKPTTPETTERPKIMYAHCCVTYSFSALSFDKVALAFM
jgi:hypothetical protein